jgi:hypothetical protein
MSHNPISQGFHNQWKIYTGWISGNLDTLTDEELRMYNYLEYSPAIP